MANYRLVFRQSVAKDLRVIPKAELRRILKRIETLTENPRPPGSEKLSGQERYRVRQGVYRVVYEIKDKELIVMIVTVAHRRKAYRG